MKPLAAALIALLLAGAPVAAQDGATLRVAADGSADHQTISAAIEAAAPGDTILIAPGEYVENLVIDKPVTLRGDGLRDEVVIVPDPVLVQRREIPDGDPVATHVFVDGVDATIEHLSLGDSERIQAGLMLTGANPVVRDIVSPRIIGANGEIDATIESSELGRIILMGPEARMTVRDSTLVDGVVVGMGATGLVEGNLILDFPVDILERSSLEVRGNTFRPEEGVTAVWVDWAGASATVVDNLIEGGWQGIHVEHGSSAHIEGNTITEPEFGIVVIETDAIIRGNTITDAGEYGIMVSGDGITAEDNTVTGGRMGIIAAVPNGYPPGAPRFDEPSRVVGNTITGASHFGLVVDAASPVVAGNTICAGREAVRFEGDAKPQIGSNEICEPEGEAGG